MIIPLKDTSKLFNDYFIEKQPIYIKLLVVCKMYMTQELNLHNFE